VKEAELNIPITDYELDLTEEDAKIFSEQYDTGNVLFKGRWIDVSNIEEIDIRETLSNTKQSIMPMDSSTIFYGNQTLVNIVTRHFIKSSPKKKKSTIKISSIPIKDVFIVHGRDYKPMKELKIMLEEFGLNPIVLHEKPSGSRTIIEKLEKHSDVGYSFVLLTPDDIGATVEDYKFAMKKQISLKKPMDQGVTYGGIQLKKILDELQSKNIDINDIVKCRARQNVVLEFGYFIGRLGRDKVCCLYKGDIELPSDMHGIVYIPFKDSVKECKNKIIKELKEAGYKI